MTDLKETLRKLYSDVSKHSEYQNIPDFVSDAFGYSAAIDEEWRGDRPRLAHLMSLRSPKVGETWLDFGANTGFFLLSLAWAFPGTKFIGVEANKNHARFIELVAANFEMRNVEVLSSSVGLRELTVLPRSDFMLHLNVLHHAGHDFDELLVPQKSDFPDYAVDYLGRLRLRTGGVFFQMGNNWGGDRALPLVGTREDAAKLRLFASFLEDSGWRIDDVAYARKGGAARVEYMSLPGSALRSTAGVKSIPPDLYDWATLDLFPGEFYRRPLFLCSH